MANWYGTARTNFVRIDDIEGLKKSLKPFNIVLQEHNQQENTFALFPDSSSDDGDFPSTIYDENDDELEFSFQEHVMPYVKEGEVLVLMKSGAEKQRYLTGYAQALVRDGDTIKEADISLMDIYEKAAKVFGIRQSQIAPCEYDSLSDEDRNALANSKKDKSAMR